MPITEVSRVEKIIAKEEKRAFLAKCLTVSGEMGLKVPGREGYENVQRIFIFYQQPMEVDLRGKLADVSEGVKVEEGRIGITAYRDNKSETALTPEGEIRLLLLDPEITIYTNGKSVALNQAIGKPVINVKRGLVTYSN